MNADIESGIIALALVFAIVCVTMIVLVACAFVYERMRAKARERTLREIDRVVERLRQHRCGATYEGERCERWPHDADEHHASESFVWEEKGGKTRH